METFLFQHNLTGCQCLNQVTTTPLKSSLHQIYFQLTVTLCKENIHSGIALPGQKRMKFMLPGLNQISISCSADKEDQLCVTVSSVTNWTVDSTALSGVRYGQQKKLLAIHFHWDFQYFSFQTSWDRIFYHFAKWIQLHLHELNENVSSSKQKFYTSAGQPKEKGNEEYD